MQLSFILGIGNVIMIWLMVWFQYSCPDPFRFDKSFYIFLLIFWTLFPFYSLKFSLRTLQLLRLCRSQCMVEGVGIAPLHVGLPCPSCAFWVSRVGHVSWAGPINIFPQDFLTGTKGNELVSLSGRRREL